MDTRKWPKSGLLTRTSGRTPSIAPAGVRAARNTHSWPNTRSMTPRHPYRWHGVAPGAPSTTAPHSAGVPEKASTRYPSSPDAAPGSYPAPPAPTTRAATLTSPDSTPRPRWRRAFPSSRASPRDRRIRSGLRVAEYRGREALGDRGEAEFSEETVDPFRRAAQSPVMPHASQQGDGEPGLLGIQFPGVYIEHGRQLRVVVLAKRSPHHVVWEVAKGAAARPGDSDAIPRQGRQRELIEPAARPVDHVGDRGRAGISVARAPHGKDARIVHVPLFDEHIERPFQTRHDRKARRPIPQNATPRDGLEHVLGAPHVLAELRLGQARDLVVPPTV